PMPRSIAMLRKHPMLRARRAIVAFCLVLVAVVAGLFARVTQTNHRAAIDAADAATRSQATVAAAYVERSFEAVDRALKAAATLATERATGVSASLVEDFLRAISRGSPVVSALSWYNADGDLVGTSQRGDSPVENIAGREDFQHYAGSSDLDLWISHPDAGVTSNDWRLRVSRRLVGADGAFAGIVVAEIRPQYFSAYFQSLNLGTDGIAA